MKSYSTGKYSCLPDTYLIQYLLGLQEQTGEPIQRQQLQTKINK